MPARPPPKPGKGNRSAPASRITPATTSHGNGVFNGRHGPASCGTP